MLCFGTSVSYSGPIPHLAVLHGIMKYLLVGPCGLHTFIPINNVYGLWSFPDMLHCHDEGAGCLDLGKCFSTGF